MHDSEDISFPIIYYLQERNYLYERKRNMEQSIYLLSLGK